MSVKQIAVNQPQVSFPFKLKHAHTIDLGAGAATVNRELGKAPIAAIILQFDMLGAGGAATVANALTQCGTKIYVDDGGNNVTPQFSAAEWYEYDSAFFGRAPNFQDGTAADNKLALLQLIIPFGRPLANANPSLFSLYDSQVGFVPKATPQIIIEYPADANSIDTRHLKIGVMYMSTKPAYTKRWNNWATQTLNTTGATDWILPSEGLLLEAFMYQTSAYNDTLTSDAPTLKNWDLTQADKSMITDGQMFNLLAALNNLTPQPDDDYIYVPFCKYPLDDLSACPRLGNDTRFKAYGGVADSFKLAVSYITPSS